MEVSTLIVDDEPDMRFLLRLTIETANHGLKVSGEAVDGAQALASWKSEKPDVVIMDNRMPGRSGIETAMEILAEDPEQAIVLFSAFLTPELIEEAVGAGIRLCLSKSQMDAIPETLWSLQEA